MTNDRSDQSADAEHAAVPAEPAPGEDSRVEDWFGQSVERDTELAEELTDEMGEDDAQKEFERRADGEQEQEARHGDEIDPDQGRSAYQDDA